MSRVLEVLLGTLALVFLLGGLYLILVVAAASTGGDMTRRFYTDPLAAAWQAKHFGMIIENEFGLCCDVGPPEGEMGSSYAESVSENQTKFYIHSTCLHLLEPQVGDLTDDGDRVNRVHEGKVVRQVADFTQLVDARIIQRDGRLFHWPESEES